MTTWSIITGEYPPQPGGVSDYTRLVAEGLAAAGDEIRVWAPPAQGPQLSHASRVRLDRLPDHFGRRGLRLVADELDRERGARILLQYVPHAFGMKAMNLPLCLMLLRRRTRDITVMFHEVAYPMSREQSLRHNALGAVNRVMAAMLVRAGSRIFVAAQAWRESLRRYAPTGCEIRWLPVPSNVALVPDRAASKAVRERYAGPATTIIGHFGAYESAIAGRLKPALEKIFSAQPDARLLLIGRGSEKLRDEFIRQNQAPGPRVFASGILSAAEVSSHIGACDLMLQPYPDGITSRNASALAALALGKAIATTTGRFTEDLWQSSGAVMLAPDEDADALARGALALIDDRDRAQAMGCAAIKLYRDVFALEHTIAAMRGA